MAFPTKRELAILNEFRQRVVDVLNPEEFKDDTFLLRWLLASDLHLDKAEAMLRNAKNWRKNNKLDKVQPGKHSDPYYPAMFPYFVDGMDKEGRPFVTLPLRNWDFRKAVRDGKSENFVKFLTESFEEGINAIKVANMLHREKNGQSIAPINQISGMLDWDGFAWGKIFNYECVLTFLQIVSIYEEYYPEILHESIFVNCSPLISSVLNFLRPILAPKTMSKIKCFGTNRNEWVPEILKRVDESQIRPQFGGTRSVDEPNPFLKKIFDK